MGDPAAAAEEYRRLITHWRRAGVWSTQWTMLRSVAGAPGEPRPPAEAAVLAGAVLATHEGHRIFGADEAALDRARPRGCEPPSATRPTRPPRARGAVLDGDAAAEHALRSL